MVFNDNLDSSEPWDRGMLLTHHCLHSEAGPAHVYSAQRPPPHERSYVEGGTSTLVHSRPITGSRPRGQPPLPDLLSQQPEPEASVPPPLLQWADERVIGVGGEESWGHVQAANEISSGLKR